LNGEKEGVVMKTEGGFLIDKKVGAHEGKQGVMRKPAGGLSRCRLPGLKGIGTTGKGGREHYIKIDPCKEEDSWLIGQFREEKGGEQLGGWRYCSS